MTQSTSPKKVFKPNNWNCLLEVGPNFAIEISGYVKVQIIELPFFLLISKLLHNILQYNTFKFLMKQNRKYIYIYTNILYSQKQ